MGQQPGGHISPSEDEGVEQVKTIELSCKK